MGKFSGVIAGILLVFMTGAAGAEWQPIEWKVSYQADGLPGDANDAIVFEDGRHMAMRALYWATQSTSLLPPGSGETVGGVCRMDTIGRDDAALWDSSMNNIPPEYQPDSRIGYTFEIRMKINDADGEMAYGPAALFRMDEMTVDDEGYPIDRAWGIALAQDPCGDPSYVGLYTDSLVYAVISPGWHTYRVTVGDDNMVKLYMDGGTTPLLQSEADNTPFDWFEWGDWTGTEDASWDLDYWAWDNTGIKVGRYCVGGALPGDINKDCYVDLADFAVLAQYWLQCNASDDPACAPMPQ